MKIQIATLLISTVAKHHASSFIITPTKSLPLATLSRRCYSLSKHSALGALPSASEAATDDFMKQLGHASQIIPLLHPSTTPTPSSEAVSPTVLLEVLSKQLSHSDGIRGFFAVYLTSPESIAVDEDVPAVLAEAVRGADLEVMVPLACMNVIMPTAMSSIHQDPELRECASKTAINGRKILRLLKDSEDVKMNCNAISSVCTGDSSGADEKLVQYWNKFFVNYNYEAEQKEGIANAIFEFC